MDEDRGVLGDFLYINKNGPLKKESILLLIILLVASFVIWGYLNPNSGSENKVHVFDIEPLIIKERTDVYDIDVDLPGGYGEAVEAGHEYVLSQVEKFKENAIRDRELYIAEFFDAPIYQYTYSAEGQFVVVSNLSSFVINEYLYTGGANGNSFIRSYTQRDGQIISLNNLLRQGGLDSVVTLVKDTIKSDISKTSAGPFIFTGAVEALNTDQLDSFSVSSSGITFYFDEYEIAAGAAGPISVTVDRRMFNF